MKFASYAILLFLIIVSCVSKAFTSSDSFLKLQIIADDQVLTYKEAVKKIQELINNMNDPLKIKNLIIESTKCSDSLYVNASKDKYERYDEAVVIGMCRLVQIRSDESLGYLVDLMFHDLSISNKEILAQRITEIGKPALVPLKKAVLEAKKLMDKGDAVYRNKYASITTILQSCIDHIKNGTKIEAGIEDCEK